MSPYDLSQGYYRPNMMPPTQSPGGAPNADPHQHGIMLSAPFAPGYYVTEGGYFIVPPPPPMPMEYPPQQYQPPAGGGGGSGGRRTAADASARSDQNDPVSVSQATRSHATERSNPNDLLTDQTLASLHFSPANALQILPQLQIRPGMCLCSSSASLPILTILLLPVPIHSNSLLTTPMRRFPTILPRRCTPTPPTLPSTMYFILLNSPILSSSSNSRSLIRTRWRPPCNRPSILGIRALRSRLDHLDLLAPT